MQVGNSIGLVRGKHGKLGHIYKVRCYGYCTHIAVLWLHVVALHRLDAEIYLSGCINIDAKALGKCVELGTCICF